MDKGNDTLTEAGYREHTEERIETLMPVLAQAAVGDYSRDVPLKAPHDEFSELYVGVQLMLEAMRDKISQLERLNDKVTEQAALLRRQLGAAEHNRAEVEALLSSIGEGVVAMNKTGRIFFVNHELVRLTGLDLEQIKDQHYYAAIALTDEAGHPIPQPDRPMHRALKSGQRVSADKYFFRSREGQLVPVAITATPVVLKNTVIGGIDIIRDITKEKEAERLKSEFVSLASHQLRTPATAVKGLLSLLLEGYSGELTPEQAKSLQLAFIENERELKLIDDMLDAAKIDAGEMILEQGAVDVGKVVKAVVAEQQELIQDRSQSVAITAPRAVEVWGDAAKLQMVFENLITNASKYSPRNSRIDIHLTLIGAKAKVSVKDEGIGIAPHDKTILFKRFSRAANAAKAHTSGSGLGLYLAKKIVDLHHGKITVTSRLGHGSTFTVTLPKQHKE